MSKLFTPEEFKGLSQGMIHSLIEQNINFVVSERINLGEGFAWCCFRETIIKRHLTKDEIIVLTKKEKDFIQLLIDAKGQLVSYDTIIKKIWKKDKASIFTIRNFINKIRQKTYYEIIKTKSNLGYRIKTTSKY